MYAAYSDEQLLQWTLDICKKFNISTFCETGTYHGNTIKILSPYFKSLISIENNIDYYNIAKDNLSELKNCNLYFGNSPEVLEKVLTNSNVFLFLDAHWENYWPLLDELTVIKEKKIKPVIAIHDFYVPDENGNAKFGYDVYKNQPLDFNYIKTHIEDIYEDGYEIKYSTESEKVNSGVIYIFPKQN